MFPLKRETFTEVFDLLRSSEFLVKLKNITDYFTKERPVVAHFKVSRMKKYDQLKQWERYVSSLRIDQNTEFENNCCDKERKRIWYHKNENDIL